MNRGAEMLACKGIFATTAKGINSAACGGTGGKADWAGLAPADLCLL